MTDKSQPTPDDEAATRGKEPLTARRNESRAPNPAAAHFSEVQKRLRDEWQLTMRKKNLGRQTGESTEAMDREWSIHEPAIRMGYAHGSQNSSATWSDAKSSVQSEWNKEFPDQEFSEVEGSAEFGWTQSQSNPQAD